MADIDKWTDAELRAKLIEYGFPVMPITGTTRKVMTKKVKMLMENKDKIKTDGRRSLARYSSEEESDTDAKPSKKNSRRATMAAPVMTQPEVTRRSNRINDYDSEQSTVKEVKTVTTRTSKIVKAAQDEFDTGSDSESEIMEEASSTNLNDARKPSPRRSPVSSYSPAKLNSSLNEPPFTSTSSAYNTGLASRYSTNLSSAERLNQIRSRLSLGNSNYERPSYSSPKPLDSSETPFLSNFTRNLMQLSSGNISASGDYDYKNDIIKEHDANGSGYSRSPRMSRYYKPLSRDFHTRQENKIFKNNLVSFTLVAVAFLFFIIVGIMYLGMRTDSSLETAGYTIPYCIKTDVNSKRGVNCVTDTDATAAINMLKYLKPHLYNVSVTHRCSNSDIKPFMTEREIVRFMQSHYSLNEHELQQDLTSLEILTFTNPLWGISVVRIDANAKDVSESDCAENMDQLIRNRDSKVTALAVLNPPVPFVCSVYNKLYAIFNTVVFLVGGFLILFTLNKGIKYYKHYMQKQRDEVFFMVERILDILQSNATDGEESFLVINHVRDMILPIKNRKGMESVWSKAVKFINENESRVRTEIQHVQGEPYEVWRWLGSAHNTSGSPRTKSWQGQAFETQVGSVNSLPCSPTPCLKIRGMIEDGDRNLHTIREAVLSKCAHQCRILHCAVDTSSNCVYLKCADPSDAAIAYRNLHGWWYSGHLVTVKYLRLERYMQRFADSPVSGPPFLKAVTPAADWSN